MGKAIKIYLANDSASGIRHAEITNWSGQALACPRSRFAELSEWQEVLRPGVYFLFGVDELTEIEAVYIGEAEVVLERLGAHISGKEFWSEVITFTSKDDNLTKAHVRYLESRLVAMTKHAGRYQLKNGSSPQLPLLPRSDCDAMEEFLGSIQMLLGVLGHKVLDPLLPYPAPSSPSRNLTADSLTFTPKATESDSFLATDAHMPAFCLSVSGLTAYAVRTDEGIVVLAGSDAASESRKSLTEGLAATRLALVQTGVIAQDGNRYKFVKDHLFRSPSQAAAVVVGYSINGRENWKLPDRTTWGAFEQRLI